ncbi:unnamed protein product [Urochloa decumbens]|uniref:Uncharacterized protein n=1 Tax=Urochloa decumbens TaxID=240449 RepID=A0ABC9G6M8_9POAL
MEPLNRANELPESTRAFYFVKIWPFEDPELRENIVEAEYAFQRKIQTRGKIVEAIKAKKEERSIIISELKTLIAENKQCHIVVEALQNHLGKFRYGNNTMQAQGTVLHSVVEELEQTIKMLSDRIVYEHISLAEEKRLVKEISDIKKAIIYLSTNRAKLQDTVDGNEATLTHDKVKIIDGIRKEQQAIRSKTKVLEDELNVVDAEIASIIQQDLVEATTRKYMAYETLQELRSKRDVKNELFIENRALLNRARDYASRGMVTEVQGLHKFQVDKFMAQWCQSKDFREDYTARALSFQRPATGQRWPDDDF